MGRIILAQLVHPGLSHEKALEAMQELESLVQTFGGLVIDKTYQKKSMPDYHTYLGKGKLEEIKLHMIEDKLDLLIIGNQLKPAQLFHIIKDFEKENIQVWDRLDLILKIFDKHAVSAEAKLQIELAAIKHMGPRIFGMGMELSRQGGGASGGKGAGRGIGETNTERMRRHLKDREIEIRKKLKEYAKMRLLHRESRNRKNLQTIGIVGYTNAGKSSLFNSLCSKQVLSEDKLFATLGTNVGKTYIFTDESFGKELLVNDTIGFIQDLPPMLIDAFASTLEDSIESNILLHIVDANDEKFDMKIKTVEDILLQIGAKQDRILVMNKIDLCDEERIIGLKKTFPDAVFVSAGANLGIDHLKKIILKNIK